MAINRKYATATIASGGTTSGAIEVPNGQPVGLFLPSALTGTAMTFTAASSENGSFIAVQAVDGASVYSVTVAASKYVPLDPRVFAGLQYIKLVSGSAEGADRSIVVALREVS